MGIDAAFVYGSVARGEERHAGHLAPTAHDLGIHGLARRHGKAQRREVVWR